MPHSQIAGHEGHVLSVAFDIHGERIASGGSDNTARLWNVATGSEELSVTAKGGRVCAVAFAAGGEELLSTSNEVVHVWSARGGRRTTLAGHTGSVWAVAVAPDGSRAVSGSADNTAYVWDLASGRRLLTLQGHTGWVTAVAYSPNAECIATGSTDNTCQLWDPSTGRRLRTLRGHTRSVTAVAFSHNGRVLATASADGTARLWDLESGKDVRALNGHRDSVTSVAFTPDSRRVVTGSVDGSCRVWDAASGRAACCVARPRPRGPPRRRVAGRVDRRVSERRRDDPLVAGARLIRLMQVLHLSGAGRLARASVRCSREQRTHSRSPLGNRPRRACPPVSPDGACGSVHVQGEQPLGRHGCDHQPPQAAVDRGRGSPANGASARVRAPAA